MALTVQNVVIHAKGKLRWPLYTRPAGHHDNIYFYHEKIICSGSKYPKYIQLNFENKIVGSEWVLNGRFLQVLLPTFDNLVKVGPLLQSQ